MISNFTPMPDRMQRNRRYFRSHSEIIRNMYTFEEKTGIYKSWQSWCSGAGPAAANNDVRADHRCRSAETPPRQCRRARCCDAHDSALRRLCGPYFPRRHAPICQQGRIGRGCGTAAEWLRSCGNGTECVALRRHEGAWRQSHGPRRAVERAARRGRPKEQPTVRPRVISGDEQGGHGWWQREAPGSVLQSERSRTLASRVCASETSLRPKPGALPQGRLPRRPTS